MGGENSYKILILEGLKSVNWSLVVLREQRKTARMIGGCEGDADVWKSRE